MKIYRKKFIIYLKTIKGKMMRKKKNSDILVGIRNRMIMKAKPTIMYRVRVRVSLWLSRVLTFVLHLRL